MRTFIVFLSMVVFAASGATQQASAQSISGIVTDEAKQPLPLVNVSLPALRRGTVTNDQGHFTLALLQAGVYTLEFSIVGFKKETRTVTVGTEDVRIEVTMRQTVLELPGIVVTGKPQPTDVLSSPQPISVTEGRELHRLRGQNVVQALEHTAGVSMYTTGMGIYKPVIRGLTSQRVLVVADGTRQEGQQWGDEHAPEIDAFDIDRIEVLRGPSSVLYGSDALGGVVHVIRHGLPSVAEGSPLLGGEITLNGFSNNRHAAGALSLRGASGAFGYRGNLSVRNAGDISTPEGKLFNSGFNEMNGGALAGFAGTWGSAFVGYARFNQELQIHEDPAEDPTATPYQKIEHDKIQFHADFPLEGVRLEADGSWQRNLRREFEKKEARIPAIYLRLQTSSLDLKGHHAPIGSLFGTLGISLMSQTNQSLGEEKLIPGFSLLNFAGYLYEEAHFGNVVLSGGLRFDTRSVELEETEELAVEAHTRNYAALTGTIGLVYRVSDPIAFSVNVGRAWRAPTPFELFVDGVHEGTFQYVTGDRNLANERSFNVDIAARYVTNIVQAELNFYRNAIAGYIFASPTGEVDSVSGFKKYVLKQADATLLGTELSLQAQVTSWLVLNGGFDVVRGTNDQTQRPLPMIPANRLRVGAKVVGSELGTLLNPYLSLHLKTVAAQDRVEEFETPTDSYTQVDVGIGGEIALGSSRAQIDFTIDNFFNVAYRDHLNRYKEYALNPGRNIALKITIPFSVLHR
jgi:iron complex outermembrane receptor protein